MTHWQEFYKSIRDPTWPECDLEQDFAYLPDSIKKECISHGYVIGQYAKQNILPHKIFPIESETACQLKWNWSTIFLYNETTASCHRTHQHKFNLDTFNFHNTEEKIDDRTRMLSGQWPKLGCEYCKNIESAGGQSDRITNLNMPGIHAPHEIDTDKTATTVTPRILEVYFDNTCNLKCVYCGPHFSSLWDAENKKHGVFNNKGLILFSDFAKSSKIDANKKKLFEWLILNRQHLTNFNILGGEPLFQYQFDQCLDLFEQYPAPDLDLQIFSNLNVSLDKMQSVIGRMRNLINKKCIRNFTVTASLDCWGAAQEYVRYPLDLDKWEQNFNLLLSEPWIKLIIGSTITPLTIHTLPDLIDRINIWRKTRLIYHYFNSVDSPSYMFIDIFGDLFRSDFDRALKIMPDHDIDSRHVKEYLAGIAKQSYSCGINQTEVTKLAVFLNEIDRRRKTSWRDTFPWLVEPINKIII